MASQINYTLHMLGFLLRIGVKIQSPVLHKMRKPSFRFVLKQSRKLRPSTATTSCVYRDPSV